MQAQQRRSGTRLILAIGVAIKFVSAADSCTVEADEKLRLIFLSLSVFVYGVSKYEQITRKLSIAWKFCSCTPSPSWKGASRFYGG